MSRILISLYLLLSLLHLYAEQYRIETLIFVTKPLLLALLSSWFYIQLRPLDSRDTRFILAGLIFSIGGDTLLMLVENGPSNPDLFLLGLGSFLLAQVNYTLGFVSFSDAKYGMVIRKPWHALPFLFYLFLIMGVLWKHLPEAMRLPVGAYSLAIMAMATAAYNLRTLLKRKYFLMLFAGVALFVLSDSLIALNKFMGDQVQIPYPRILIMFTYLLGQFLIAGSIVFARQER